MPCSAAWLVLHLSPAIPAAQTVAKTVPTSGRSNKVFDNAANMGLVLTMVGMFELLGVESRYAAVTATALIGGKPVGSALKGMITSK